MSVTVKTREGRARRVTNFNKCDDDEDEDEDNVEYEDDDNVD